MEWIVYILECADFTLYTGITNDLEKRLAAHAVGKGAKYTRGRGPFKVRFREKHTTRGSASKREGEIKAMSREQKRTLIALREARR